MNARTVKSVAKEWPEMLTIREVAKYLGLSHRTLESWKGKGLLPQHYEFTSRHHAWRRSDIDAWIEKFRIEGEVAR